MQNQTMIPTAYSKKVLAIIQSYAILIPSTTHGDQAAIEVYLRAMVNQFDDTQCGDRYCDWAFHNYLYYFGGACVVVSSLFEVVWYHHHHHHAYIPSIVCIM